MKDLEEEYKTNVDRYNYRSILSKKNLESVQEQRQIEESMTKIELLNIKEYKEYQANAGSESDFKAFGDFNTTLSKLTENEQEWMKLQAVIKLNQAQFDKAIKKTSLINEK
jgi:hypothetical protein